METPEIVVVIVVVIVVMIVVLIVVMHWPILCSRWKKSRAKLPLQQEHPEAV